MRGNDIVVDALRDVQHSMGGSIDATQGQLEEFQGRFVGLGLLRGDDCIEVYAELRARAREQIIVHIRENRQPKATLELAKSVNQMCIRDR